MSSSTNWSDGGVPSQFTTGRAVIFGDNNPIGPGAVGTSSVVIQGTGVNPFSVLFTNAGSAHGGVDYTFMNASGTAGIGSNASIVMEGTGNVTFQSANSFTGSVSIDAGQLIASNGGALGSSSGVTVASGAALTLNGGINVSNSIPLMISGTGIGSNGALDSTGGDNTYAGPITLAATATINSDPIIVTHTLTLTGGLNVGSNTVIFTGSGNTSETGKLTVGPLGAVSVAGSGIVTFNASTGSAISATNNGVSVSPGATLQITGTKSDLSDATSSSSVANVANNGNLTVIGTTTQSVGTVTGMPSTDVNGATVYGGVTTVGDGINAATLTAGQLLQNSLVIGANSTVAIVPSTGSGPGVSSAASATTASASSAAASSSSTASSASSDGSSDPLTAVESAVSSGAISSSQGEILEDRLSAIDRMAAANPDLDVSSLDNRVMGQLAAWTNVDAANPAILSNMLSLDSSISGSSASGLGGGLSGGLSLSGGAAAVPEPSTLLLVVLGGLGVAFAIRRRRVCCN